MYNLKNVRENKVIYFTCNINRKKRQFRFDERSISEYIDKYIGWKDINTWNDNQEYNEESIRLENDLINSYYYYRDKNLPRIFKKLKKYENNIHNIHCKYGVFSKKSEPLYNKIKDIYERVNKISDNYIKRFDENSIFREYSVFSFNQHLFHNIRYYLINDNNLYYKIQNKGILINSDLKKYKIKNYKNYNISEIDKTLYNSIENINGISVIELNKKLC